MTKKCGSAMTKKCGSAMTKKCRFLDHGFLDPYTNMAVDEVLLAGQSPVLRFYQWTVPTISAGYFQKNEQLLYKKSQALNFGFVRRITGGRAVLHADELTYSVVLPNDKGKSVLFFYREISQVLLDAFREIGLETADFQAGKSKEQKSAFCFLSPSFYEIIVQGKKLVGSSQIQRHGFLLQHGSIPFTLDYGVLADIFSCQDDLKNSIISLEEALGHKINKKELKKALLRSFEKNLEVESSQEELSLDEKAEVSRLVKEKYSQLTWNIRDKG